ncbi:MAG: caspase family protein [Pseudomonadota bacterium]
MFQARKITVFYVFATALFIVFSLAFQQGASASMQPGPGKGWLTIASRTQPQDAINLAQGYASRFPTAVVFHSSNGFYAVSLGWSDIKQATPLLQRLKASGAIPGDSYFTAGARFLRAIWSANNSQDYPYNQMLAATQLNLGYDQVAQPPAAPPPPVVTPMSERQAFVTGLDTTGDNFLSLRIGPSTKYSEIARMRSGTSMTVSGSNGRWLKVRLSNGMEGWAFSRYVAYREVPVIGPSETVENTRGDQVPVIGPDEKVAEKQPDPAPSPPKPEPKQEPVITIEDQKRVALILGNSEYQNTTALPNPKNDAADMSAKLQSLGFEVITSLDGTKTDMEMAVRSFVKALPGADVALFFYAGHAMQVNGKNHLIPIDAKLEDSTAIDFETIDLGVILDFMNANDRISIALLDACRDNPLSRRFARNFSASRSAFIGRGLAAPSTGSGELLIGFATAPGEVALDGDGDNSPFTTALLKHIDAKGLDVELMLKRVRQDVYELTDQSQEPWVNSALRREFQFNP